MAAHATLDAEWPHAETEKSVLRSYLRRKGLLALVRPLSESLKEFEQSVGRHLIRQSPRVAQAMETARAKMAWPAFRSWCGLGRPGREAVLALAEGGNAPAQAIVGLRVLLGVATRANPLFGIRKLEAAFAAGFTPAASMLELYYHLALDIETSNAWIVRGARAGDRACVCQVHARSVAERSLRTGAPLPEIEPAEIAQLVAAHVGETGEVEWHVGRGLGRLGLLDGAMASFRTAVEKGWPAAFRDGADLQEALGRTREAREWRLRGARAGDDTCKVTFARERLLQERETATPLPAAERAGLIADIVAASQRGVRAALGPMVYFYKRGDGLPRDDRRAEMMAAAEFLVAESPAARENAAELLKEVRESDEGPFPMSAALEWLFSSCADSDNETIQTVSAQAWVECEMENPPPMP